MHEDIVGLHVCVKCCRVAGMHDWASERIMLAVNEFNNRVLDAEQEGLEWSERQRRMGLCSEGITEINAAIREAIKAARIAEITYAYGGAFGEFRSDNPAFARDMVWRICERLAERQREIGGPTAPAPLTGPV